MMNTFDKQKLYDSYAAALSKAWECYIRIVDLLLGLSGATALVFVASVKITDWSSLPNKGLIVYVFILSALAIVCGVCWRFASQHFMEYETLGSRVAASLYFDITGIKPVTTTSQASESLRSFYRRCYRIIPWFMGFFLLSAWVLIFLVFFGESVANPPLSEQEPMYFSENILRSTTIIYNSLMVLMSFGAFFTWVKYKEEVRKHSAEKLMQEKHNFLSCTERYIKIQEMIINTDCLSDLNLSIYQPAQDKPFDEKVFSKELALCGMMFQLMEDVWLMHNLEENKGNKLYAGWCTLFAHWMKTKKIAQKWDLLKSHFSKGFVEYVEREFIPSSTVCLS